MGLRRERGGGGEGRGRGEGSIKGDIKIGRVGMGAGGRGTGSVGGGGTERGGRGELGSWPEAHAGLSSVAAGEHVHATHATSPACPPLRVRARRPQPLLLAPPPLAPPHPRPQPNPPNHSSSPRTQPQPPTANPICPRCRRRRVLHHQGGDILLTVTSDDKHTIHVWRWLPSTNKYANAHYIPGWYLGPEKKILPLKGAPGGERQRAGGRARERASERATTAARQRGLGLGQAVCLGQVAWAVRGGPGLPRQAGAASLPPSLLRVVVRARMADPWGRLLPPPAHRPPPPFFDA